MKKVLEKAGWRKILSYTRVAHYYKPMENGGATTICRRPYSFTSIDRPITPLPPDGNFAKCKECQRILEKDGK